MERRQAIWQDTTPLTPKAAGPLNPIVVGTARRCAQQFSVDRSYRDWDYYLHLLLLANRDDDAAGWARKHLASLQHSDTETLRRMQRTAKDTLLNVYLKATPVRMAPAWPLIEEFLADLGTSVWTRGELLRAVFDHARATDDTARARWAAEQLNQVAGTISESDKMTNDFHGFRSHHYAALGYLTRRAQLDSLRRGTSGYVAIKQQNWVRSGNDRSGETFLIGQRAPALAGDFWFPAAGARDGGEAPAQGGGPQVATTHTMGLVRPMRGQVNLFVFLTRRCLERAPVELIHDDRNETCWGTYAGLRRLASRYPDLKVTIVSRTFGHLWPVIPSDPAAEANLLYRWWTEFHRIPAAVVVTKTDFWRLPDPDHRRINEKSKYEEAYGGRWAQVVDQFAVLVNRDGIIVEARTFRSGSEQEWVELLDAVAQQQ